jgi:hypothetical protein
MTRHVRRKSEVVGLANEQHFSHLVEVAISPEGMRDALLEFEAFHRERRIPVYRGRSRHVGERFHIRFCFPDTATADADLVTGEAGEEQNPLSEKSQSRAQHDSRSLSPCS